jgi:glutathione synthase/RimK-type ligase-like ATP-grasp enzyme
LLESGLLAKLKGLPEEKASRCRRFFKKILLQKYFSKKTEFRKRIVVVEKKPRTKPIQKLQKAPSKPKTVRSP